MDEWISEWWTSKWVNDIIRVYVLGKRSLLWCLTVKAVCVVLPMQDRMDFQTNLAPVMLQHSTHLLRPRSRKRKGIFYRFPESRDCVFCLCAPIWPRCSYSATPFTRIFLSPVSQDYSTPPAVNLPPRYIFFLQYDIRVLSVSLCLFASHEKQFDVISMLANFYF